MGLSCRRGLGPGGLSFRDCEMGPTPLHTSTTQGLRLGVTAEAAARKAAFAKGWLPPGQAQLGWVTERWRRSIMLYLG